MEWISVKDGLPCKDKEVLVVTEQNARMVGWLSLEFNALVWLLTPYGYTYDEEFGKVTHWAYLPEPPRRTHELQHRMP